MSTASAALVCGKVYDSPQILDLLQQVRHGDEQAFTELYKMYYPRVLGVCQRKLIEPDIAEHTANWVLTRAWLKIETFKEKSSFSTWLTRIAMNASLMHLRSQNAERRVISHSLDETVLPRDCSNKLELAVRDLQLEGVIDRHALRYEIASLPPILRVVFILRMVKECTTEETCKALKLDIFTVKSRLYRARHLVAKSLREKRYKVGISKRMEAAEEYLLSLPSLPVHKRGNLPHTIVERMWSEGKMISEIAHAIGRVDANPKDPYHSLRNLLCRMHKGYQNDNGEIVKLPYRVTETTVWRATKAGKRACKN
jgi:RNA polymerase sigma-70 factor (ECF subfamily)